jgi:hypothetical protein
MSTLIAKNIQVGTSGTPADNFTIFQPATPDGTLRIGNGNTGITTGLVTLNSAGNLGIGTSSPGQKLDVVGNIRGSGFILSTANGGSGYISPQSASACNIGTDNGSLQLVAGTVGVAATINTSGNLGLGVTPSAWYSASKAFQIGPISSLESILNASILSANTYRNASAQLTYLTTAAAGQYAVNGNVHSWNIAPSGTAGNAISFTQAMTLDASGNLLVGTTTATNTANKNLEINGTGDSALNVSVGGTNIGYVYASASSMLVGSRQNVPLVFNTNATERARIDSSGNLLVAKTSSATSSVGFEARTNGVLSNTVNGITGVFINRLGNDGSLIDFQQDNSAEGSISVSGTTVSYNGGHLSRWAQTTTAKDETLVKGTVLSNLDEMNVYTDADGNPVDNEQLNKVKVSDVEGDANVAGVFVNWSHDEAHDVDEINMAMTGDMIIRIAQGVTVQRGDLLMSAGDGTAKPQGDDIVRSKTVAKVTSTHVTCTYADGSFCVPCVLMAC